MKALLFSFVFAASASAKYVSNLNSKLHNYDIIHSDGLIRRLYKRGTPDHPSHSYNRIHEVVLKPFGKNLNLLLTPTKGLFDKNFVAVSKNSQTGTESSVWVDPEDFLEGRVSGESNSRVSAHFEETGAITGTVVTPDETYFFEPAWRHLPHLPANATLAYKQSDLKSDLDETVKVKTCGEAVESPGEVLFSEASKEEAAQFRSKRQTTKGLKNRCALKLVADYRFFRKIGNSKPALTIRYLVNLIQRVNDIYTSTVWKDELGSSIENQGFVIKKIEVEEAPVRGHPNHWNMERTEPWEVGQLLRTFTVQQGTLMKDFCLVHLFTYQSFQGGVLGLGYIASARVGDSGGICSAATKESGRLVFYNTALSSARSTYGDAVITREADIVTAHEFGHNWGSVHDPNGDECSPSYSQGGSYIMNTFSVQGYDSNNKLFSPCSIRTIHKVLESRSDLCFVEEDEQFCGNQRVERGETCDVGVSEAAKRDLCCSWRTCQFNKPQHVCSPNNTVCCTQNCQFSREGTVCHPAAKSVCKKESFCNNQGHCLEPEAYPNGTECRDKGECQNGECVSFCEKQDIGMKPCICTKVEESCFRCCKNSRGECKPYGKQIPFKDKRPCIHGYCDEKGVCVKGSQDVIEHIWSIIQSLDSDSVADFLKRNVVGTIIILSLIVWIPASCIVHHIDKKRQADARKQWPHSEGNFAGKNRIEVAVGIKNIGRFPSDGHQL